MNEDQPFEMPPPGIVADWCAQRAWCNNIDDKDRLIHEMSSNTIRQLIIDRNKALSRAEQWEAEAMTYAAILYGPNQKGGAA